MEVYSNIEIW